MPELPEVETIRLGLDKKIVGSKINRVQILSAKSFIGNPSRIEGQTVLRVSRRAKILVIDLSSDLTLLIHLKMTGQLIWKGEMVRGKGESLVGGHPTTDMFGELPNSHTRVIFSFSGPLRPQSQASGSQLYFNDQRKFGWVKVVTNTQIMSNKLFENLGPEPLEKQFTWQILKSNILRHKSMSVKVALMDPKVVAGVGNIYANEACFDARIDPRTKVSQLSDGQFKMLHNGVVKSLKDGIKYGGATRAHFVDSDGHKGYFLDYAYCYGRDKHPCKICGTEIKKVQSAGRGTYFCPKCQS